jgi:diguanylate cyclase (GGDEF)-like protein
VRRPWWGDRALAGLGALAVLTVLAFGTGLLPVPVVAISGWVLAAALQVTEVLLCLAVAASAFAVPAQRRFWRLLAGAAAMFAAGSLVQLVVAFADPYARVVATGAPAHLALLALGAAFLVVAMLTSPLGIATRRERFRFWLDAATVMVGVSLYAWQLTGLADGWSGRGPTTGALVVALFGPAAFLVVVFGIVKIAMGGAAPFTRAAGALGCAAAALESLNTAMIESPFPTDRLGWQLGLGALANIAFTAGVRVQLLQMRRGPASARRAGRPAHSTLPYLAVGASFGLLVWTLSHNSQSAQAWLVLAGVIACCGLVVVRQLAAFADNDALFARLNANVRELADAQQVLRRALTERDDLAARLRHLAYHDDLTGLANRAKFLERVTGALARGRRTGRPPSVIVIDLDGFKPVNDAHGHRAGDALLRELGHRLSSCVREVDLVARLGGDEFAILLEETGADHIAALVGRVATAVRQPVRLGPVEVSVSASIGTATGDGPAEEWESLVHRADLAMYAEKRARHAKHAAPGAVGAAPVRHQLVDTHE